MSQHRSFQHLFRTRAGRLLCAPFLAQALATLAASPARAGIWTLVSCAQPDGSPAPTEGWSTGALGALGPYSGDLNTCAAGGSLTARSSGEAPQSAYGGPEWVFSAPAGSTIAGGTLTAALTAPGGQAWLGTPDTTYDSADVLANCQYNLACGQAGTLISSFPITHPGGSHIYLAAVCVGKHEGDTSCPANGGLDAAAYLSAADIELANDSSPTASGFSGALLEDNARGSSGLTFRAEDPSGPGVYQLSVQADGQTLYAGTPDSNDGHCVALAPSSEEGGLLFDSEQPCKQSETIAMPIDTTTLTDGPHTLTVRVTDAAQNSSVVYDATINTENAPSNTKAPTILAATEAAQADLFTAAPGVWSVPEGAGPISYSYQWKDCDREGENCFAIPGAQTASYTPGFADGGGTLRLLVEASDRDGSTSLESSQTSVLASAPGSLATLPSPIGATVAGSGGTVNGSGGSEDARIALAIRASTITRSFSRRALRLSGRLLDGDGQPIADASLEVLSQAAGAVGRTPISSSRTATDGEFTAEVPSGPSRLVTIAYRARSGDALYAAEAELKETVDAAVTLHVSPRHATAAGDITLSGQVSGPIPARGVVVTLLVYYRGHWEPFRDPRTDSRGTFHVRYQFEGAVGRFPFRAEVLGEQAGLPYATGESATASVWTA